MKVNCHKVREGWRVQLIDDEGLAERVFPDREDALTDSRFWRKIIQTLAGEEGASIVKAATFKHDYVQKVFCKGPLGFGG